jgi:hypothetical protein
MPMQDMDNRLRIRKDRADLSPGERKAFVTAVLALKQMPSQLYPDDQAWEEKKPKENSARKNDGWRGRLTTSGPVAGIGTSSDKTIAPFEDRSPELSAH